MIALCTQCQHVHELEVPAGKTLADFKCNKCGGVLESADLRWCIPCGKTKHDLEILNGVVMPEVEVPATRYIVPHGTTHCPAGHAFRPVERSQ
jgi:hypothetical protein